MTFRGKGARWFAGLALIALLGGLATSLVRANSSPDAIAALQRGQHALDQHDPRTARVELMNAIKADPSLAAARIAQARALLMLGNSNGAQDELDRALALGTPPASVRHLLAHAALLQGRASDAVQLAEANDIDPQEAEFAARIAGQAHQALGQYQQAAHAFDRALALAPNDAALWADIARLRMAVGDMAAAFTAADRAVALAPNNVETLSLRAVLIREQYGLIAALPWFDKALAARPDDVPVIIEYAATLSDAGQARRALALTRRALALVPGLPRAYYIQAVMAARAGEYDLSRTLLARTHGALDGRAATRLLRAVLHQQSGNATLAIEQLLPVLTEQPLNLRVRLLLARAYYQDGQYAQADRTLFPIVERADADSYALTLAARIQEALGQRTLAGAYLTRANAPMRGAADVFRGAGSPADVAGEALAQPTQAAPSLRYIRALLEAGQVQAALTRATILRVANPGAPAAHIVLGDCLNAAGKFAEAARAYEQAGNLRFDEISALRIVAAWQRAGQPAKAQRALALFLAQNPAHIDANRLAATLWLASGNFDRAISMLERLQTRLGNEDALLMSDLARAWLGKGDTQRALGYAAHAYRLQPGSAVTSDIFGWALFRSGERNAVALDLLKKAAQLSPREPLVQQHLQQLYAAMRREAEAPKG